MLITFHIELNELYLLKLKVHFTFQDVIYDLLSIFGVNYLIDLVVVEFFKS